MLTIQDFKKHEIVSIIGYNKLPELCHFSSTKNEHFFLDENEQVTHYIESHKYVFVIYKIVNDKSELVEYVTIKQAHEMVQVFINEKYKVA